MLPPIYYNLRNRLITIKCKINKHRLYFWPTIVVACYELTMLISKNNYLKNLNGNHFDILSINTTLAGFLFTGISIMITINDKPFIKQLKKAGYWHEMYNSAYLGILSNIFSMIISLIGVIVKNMPLWMINIEILFLIIGISYFVLTICSLKDTLYLL